VILQRGDHLGELPDLDPSQAIHHPGQSRIGFILKPTAMMRFTPKAALVGPSRRQRPVAGNNAQNSRLQNLNSQDEFLHFARVQVPWTMPAMQILPS